MWLCFKVPNYDSDEYDEDWAEVQVKVSINYQQFLNIRKRIVTTEEKNINPIRIARQKSTKKANKSSKDQNVVKSNFLFMNVMTLKMNMAKCQIQEKRKYWRSYSLRENDEDCDDYHDAIERHFEAIIERVCKIDPVPLGGKRSDEDDNSNDESHESS
ncbi:hypothetical protein FDP41_010105 [Naegleria fowleri]|uniref:Uncharacterized protein n=1 Tax=Naegleria fowleri TaxID=5763 RepID=A0A6A5B9R5_NAEFO|nr:uncharacterized protein FDP41_010105 [Naegleria fowleri]KAF0971882.1 hypothetical protein FDP41_010105 [Naegleria fowleri]CAG4709665.1 unnamed protein product [Naegleria fowleri]